MARREGQVIALCIAPAAGDPMRRMQIVKAIAGAGLEGDRYSRGEGSYNQKTGVGRRQVTLINGLFFEGTGFTHLDSRRNIVTMGVELMELIGQEFDIGEARFRGLKYCDPCQIPQPSTPVVEQKTFREAFWDRGGIIAEILRGGLIGIYSPVVPPHRNY